MPLPTREYLLPEFLVTQNRAHTGRLTKLLQIVIDFFCNLHFIAGVDIPLPDGFQDIVGTEPIGALGFTNATGTD